MSGSHLVPGVGSLPSVGTRPSCDVNQVREVTSSHRITPSISSMGFPGGSEKGKESACSPGDLHSIPGLGRPPGGGLGNPLQCSCLENPMERGAWRATVHRTRKESDMTELKHISSTNSVVLKQSSGLSLPRACTLFSLSLSLSCYPLNKREL